MVSPVYTILALEQPWKLTIYSFLCNRGFAVGWDYAISWLIMLPFELTAASITIKYWRDDLNAGIFIAAFLVILIAIQFFGVKGYGEGKEFCSLNHEE